MPALDLALGLKVIRGAPDYAAAVESFGQIARDVGGAPLSVAAPGGGRL